MHHSGASDGEGEVQIRKKRNATGIRASKAGLLPVWSHERAGFWLKKNGLSGNR